MTVLKAVLNRDSIRRYSDKPVDRETLLTCLEAARLAPSAENSQPWRFIVLTDSDIKTRFGKNVFTGIYKTSQFVLKAPAILVLCADLDFTANRMGKLFTGIPFYLLDVGMAGEHFALQAAEMGLGTCWIGWFNMKKAHKALKLPKKIRICAMMAVGYPTQDWRLKPHKRKKLEDIVHWNGW
ncbi:nitroreductase family protein [bacterium]|nr:nitroreductase family protein [bacterium]